MQDAYARQDRGSDDAYDRYLRQMDASMRQKVALTAAHLLCEGQLADMGMGSGTGSHALAQLYPGLEVIGVDVNPEMVARARAELALPNLRFAVGDVAKPCFAPGSVQAILDSSVLHHVTSFNGYDRPAAARALAVQVEALAPGGVLVVRDFVDPGPGTVWLDLPGDDGSGDDPKTCSTAALFERFAREFRILLPEGERGFAYRELLPDPACPLAPGFRRFEVARPLAVEFALRKDYRDSWELEVQEEYGYATQAELEALFARLGLRVLASTPIRNPWIVEHRFRGKLALWSERGEPLDFPATNYVIVGQKAPPGEGTRLVEGPPHAPLGYLQMSCWRGPNGVYDLVRRPNTTVDVLPWYRQGGSAFVLARRSYPRPIVGCEPRGTRPIDGSTPATYVTEPLNVQLRDRPLGQTAEELLAAFPGIGAEAIVSFEHGSRYLPSPGGIQEQVESLLVEIAPVATQTRLDNLSGFSTSGVLRAIEARQLLRAAQVGGLPDARLELNTYDLLLRLGIDPGEWIGEAIDPRPLDDAPREASLAALLGRPHRRAFRAAAAAESTGFLELCCAEFVEIDAAGREVARRPLEMVLPRTLSFNTVAVALLARRPDGGLLIGVDDHDLPAAQCFVGNSEILVAPAWRLPKDVHGIARSRAWIAERVAREYGVPTGRIWELGGRYHPSPGLTPEVVYPLAIEALGPGRCHWVPLDEAVGQRHALHDGHLRIVALRAAHALGVLSD